MNLTFSFCKKVWHWVGLDVKAILRLTNTLEILRQVDSRHSSLNACAKINNGKLVQYSSGPKQFIHRMVCYSSHVLNGELIVCYLNSRDQSISNHLNTEQVKVYYSNVCYSDPRVIWDFCDNEWSCMCRITFLNCAKCA